MFQHGAPRGWIRCGPCGTNSLNGGGAERSVPEVNSSERAPRLAASPKGHGTVGQIPLARIQKLSVHIPPEGTVCRPEYLPSCARFPPLLIADKGSKKMNSRVSQGGVGGR